MKNLWRLVLAIAVPCMVLAANAQKEPSSADLTGLKIEVVEITNATPDTTQDLVRGCEPSFTAAPISGDWITRAPLHRSVRARLRIRLL